MKRLVACAAAAGFALAPAASLAATVAASGWWTSAPLAAAPDVPADGMLLQGGPAVDQPVAYGAVSFTLDDGEEPSTLTLTVADGAATTPNASITVCPLTSELTPAQGGAAADGPTFDCTASVGAERSDDGATFEVDVAGMAAGGTLAVALLPSAVTDRIVLEAPGATSLATSGAGAAGPSSGSSGSSSGSAGTATGSGSSGSSGSPAPRGGTAPAPRVPQPATPVPAPATTAAPATRPATLEPAAVPGDEPGPDRTFAFVALVVLMGALWMVAGTPNPTTAEPSPGAQP